MFQDEQSATTVGKLIINGDNALVLQAVSIEGLNLPSYHVGSVFNGNHGLEVIVRAGEMPEVYVHLRCPTNHQCTRSRNDRKG